jgi:hypothetical protein
MAWEVPDSFLETQCESCHRIAHKAKSIQSFVIKDKLTSKKIIKLSKAQKVAKKISRMVSVLSDKDKAIQARYDRVGAA